MMQCDIICCNRMRYNSRHAYHINMNERVETLSTQSDQDCISEDVDIFEKNDCNISEDAILRSVTRIVHSLLILRNPSALRFHRPIILRTFLASRMIL
ncbi:hypothetical protein PUN28_013804 [Cardiocondyla obscurior]|uniref:Uncharacterized protein n=1 Tax=Cardiocondyla obscurior TaxID=286306 RepID=A0AAW2F353_9HYME